METVKALNPWRDAAHVRAERLVEDVDRKSLTAQLLSQTIMRLEQLATTSAYAIPEPKISRHQNEEGVVFEIEWLDQESGWFLCVSVKRKHGQKPFVALEFSGNPKNYSTDRPTDDDVRQAMHDYFYEWKRER